MGKAMVDILKGRSSQAGSSAAAAVPSN